MFSTIQKFQSELSVEVHRLSHVLDCQVDRPEVLYFHDAENGPGGGLGGLGGGAGGLGGRLSFMIWLSLGCSSRVACIALGFLGWTVGELRHTFSQQGWVLGRTCLSTWS